MAWKTLSTRKMLWKHGEQPEGKSTENPSRLNNVGNLPRSGVRANSKRLRFLYAAAPDSDAAWCIALLLFGTHITSGITIFPLCCSFCSWFFFCFSSSASLDTHKKHKNIQQRSTKKNDSSEMGKSAIMMCIQKSERERNIKAGGVVGRGSKKKGRNNKAAEKKWMEIVVVLILKPFQFQSHLWNFMSCTDEMFYRRIMLGWFMRRGRRRKDIKMTLWSLMMERRRKINSFWAFFVCSACLVILNTWKSHRVLLLNFPSLLLNVDTCQQWYFHIHNFSFLSFIHPRKGVRCTSWE